MTTPIMRGLTQAADLLSAAQIAHHADEEDREKRDHVVLALLDSLERRELTKQAGPYTAGGKGALVGAGLGALIGGIRRFAKLRGLAAAPARSPAIALARKLDRVAQSKLRANPKYLRSAAEHQAGQDLKFVAGRKALGGKRFRDAPLDYLKLYGEPLGRAAASWGTTGAALGHGAEAGLKALKKQRHINLAKKWALPAAAGLVGAKVLLD